jgi:FtsH-binding integral membrane protein
MQEAFFAKVTLLGDPLLLLFCGFGVFFYLWSDDERRALARSWAISFGLCVLLTVAGKFVLHLIRWNDGTALRLLSPSGHVAIGTSFYGCCAMMLSMQQGRTMRAVIWTGVALLLGLIAVSRLVLQLHSVPEIVLAFAIGGVSLTVFICHPDSHRPVQLRSGQMIALIVLLAVAFLTPHLSGEALILYVTGKIGN